MVFVGCGDPCTLYCDEESWISKTSEVLGTSKRREGDGVGGR